ncbi:EVE domain-containing protein [Nocardia sp. alder85J]|uniref:EVE domain-containing protein n=1 Tax=Nocardia sp. alder85J TaxID=2862949 RepID=UPI001CD3AF75|nr:EVE domain-containing protein [Nocardia sp. alder85J]MCX4092327.1 EVE domain-containing protein [Nocardia sp. alder85J]
MTRYWLAVVSRDHVHRAVKLGIAQANHGKRAAVERMAPGDGLVYYSPRTGIRDGEQIRSFTALGAVDDASPWQAEDQGGGFCPWRRSVTYQEAAQDVPIDRLRGELELTATPNWGIVLRRGLVELTAHDYAAISRAMVGR